MSNPQLQSLAGRIEKLMDERDGIQSDIRDIYAEAKSNGYVPKVLRKAITRKRMDTSKRDEEDAILGLYEAALSPTMRVMVALAKAGASSHQIEAATGVDHSTVARSVALNKKSATVTEPAASPPNESCGSTEGRAGASASLIENGDRSADRYAASRIRASEAAGTPETAAMGPAGVEPGPQEPDIDAENASIQERINAARRRLQEKASA